MPPEVDAMHRESGLIADLDRAYLSATQVEGLAVSVLEPFKGCPAAGSSVHFDRRWLAEKMPSLNDLFHYRNVDVSTIKELVSRWMPEVSASLPPSRKRHRALDDIRDSIGELKYYRKNAFR